jgi:hypothetical protein
VDFCCWPTVTAFAVLKAFKSSMLSLDKSTMLLLISIEWGA